MERQLSRIEADLREPSARELVQRHRITSTSSMPFSSPKRVSLSVLKRGGSIVPSVNQEVTNFSLNRDCVFSLHQNFRTNLLYGKNNVEVLSTTNSDRPLKGYLSLHQDISINQLMLKWTPNMLMHFSSQSNDSASCNQCNYHEGCANENHVLKNKNQHVGSLKSRNILWKYAINVCFEKIIYLHLHQQGENEPAQLVLVDTEGVQHSSFQFPTSQQCVTFLAALESGLAPSSQLDPPLCNINGKEKVLPKLCQKTNVLTKPFSIFNNSVGNDSIQTDLNESTNDDDKINNDYVFRIVRNIVVPKNLSLNNKSANRRNSLLNNNYEENSHKPTAENLLFESTHIKLVKKEKKLSGNIILNSLSNACESMRQQIVSRAFYGWLAYYRHLKTIRTHLATIVTTEHIQCDDAENSVNDEFWKLCRSERTIVLYSQLLVRVYLYGIDNHLRSKVWPYLLHLVDWHEDLDENFIIRFSQRYNKEIDNWKVIEEEVIRRDLEAFKEAKRRQKCLNDNETNEKSTSTSFETDSYQLNFKSVSDVSDTSSFEKSFDSIDLSSQINVNGSIKYSIVENFGKNLHRIDKDVERCDRNTQFYSNKNNLERLRRLMCTYVWRHLIDGYIQGMCDIAAPLLVIFDNEVLALECFEIVMARLAKNFPHKNHGIESNLNNLRSLVQVMDPDLFYQVMNNDDYTHLYFAYRWFLLDFKREVTYNEVFRVWETIWAAEKTVSGHFQLFFALALLTQYREVLIENNMDFTDVIKFFNEMAEKHNVDDLLKIAREKLNSLQEIILDIRN